MREIEWTTRFKQDYKREKKGRRRRTLDRELASLVGLLAKDESIPGKFRDHPLTGEWREYRDCHIKPDLLLIYRKLGDDVLQLAACRTIQRSFRCNSGVISVQHGAGHSTITH